MAQIISFVLAVAFSASVVYGIVFLESRRHRRLMRTVAALAFCYALMCLGGSFGVSAGTPQLYLIFSQITYLAYFAATPVTFVTVSAFVGDLSRRVKVVAWALALVAIAEAFMVLIGRWDVGGYMLTMWGNVATYDEEPFFSLIDSIIHYLSLLLMLILVFRRYRKSASLRYKKVLRMLLPLTIVISVAQVALTYVCIAFSFPNVSSVLFPVSLGIYFFLYQTRRWEMDYSIVEKHILGLIQDGVILIDAERHIVQANGATQSVLGISANDLEGKSIESLFESPETIQIAWKEAVATRTSVPINNVASSGSVFMTLSAAWDDFGDLLGGVVIVRSLDALDAASNRYRLSPQEQTVVKHLLNGTPNKEIADMLFISPGTVKRHTHNIYSKTGAANRAELFRILLKDGAIETSDAGAE